MKKYLVLVGLTFSGISIAQISVPQQSPYTVDANTVLLEHFDGATTGSPHGSVTYTNGVFGQGVQLNTSSWIQWAMGALTNGTVEFWGKMDNITNCPSCTTFVAPDFVWSYLSPSEIGTGPGSTLVINVSATNDAFRHYGMPAASVHNGSTWLNTPTNSLVIVSNVWHHYALTWGALGLHFYVDGNLVGTNAPGVQNQGTTAWTVSNNNGAGFNGAMDELRISKIQRTFSPFPVLSIETAAIRLRWFAQANVTYDVQWSTNFQTWSNLTTVVGTGAETNVVDWTETRRFYRLSVPQ